MVLALQVVAVALLSRASHARDVLIASLNDRILICPYDSPCGACTELLGKTGPLDVNNPTSVKIDSNGFVIIAEGSADRILKCGAPPGGEECATEIGAAGEGSGPNQVNYPWGLAIDDAGNYIIADKNNNRIQKCNPTTSSCETVAGGNKGEGPAELDNPYDVTLDSAGDYIIADRDNNRIQKCPAASPGSSCTTIAGGTNGGSGLAQLSQPYSAMMDPSGNLFVGDKGNARVMVCPPGETNCQVFMTDSQVQAYGLAWDPDGFVVVVDKLNSKIMKCPYPKTDSGCEVVAGSGCGDQDIGTPWAVTLYAAASTPAPTTAAAPAPPAGMRCFSKSQCKRGLKWWQKTFDRKVRWGPDRFMKGFLHDSYFAECSGGAKKIAMVIPSSKSCPQKVHTRRSTKVFRARATRKQAFCKPVEYTVCSYCIQLNVPPGRGVMIEAFKESRLAKPDSDPVECKNKFWDFPNTPAK